MSGLGMNQVGALGGLGYMASTDKGYADLLEADAKAGGAQHWDIMRDRDAWRKGKPAPAPRAGVAPAATAPAAPAATAPAYTAPAPTATTPTRTTYPTYTAPARRPSRQSSLAPLSALFPGSAQAQAAGLRQQVAQASMRQRAAAVGRRPSWEGLILPVAVISLGLFGLAIMSRQKKKGT